jgi:hypothetical protein
MQDPGSIPDPRMNPNGEKSFGFAFRYKDGHYYVYIKGKSDPGNSDTDSRYFSAGTQVLLGKEIKQSLLIVSTKGNTIDTSKVVDINEYLQSHDMTIKPDWNGDPVVFELIEVEGLNPEITQDVVKKCNQAAQAELEK